MRFLVPIFAAVALAKDLVPLTDLGSAIGRLVDDDAYPGEIQKRVNTLSNLTSAEKIKQLASIAADLYQNVCEETSRWLHRSAHSTPELLLHQMVGVPMTINATKVECDNAFPDYPTPCHQVVDAASVWCSARMCREFARGLDPNSALRYGLCLDDLPAIAY